MKTIIVLLVLAILLVAAVDYASSQFLCAFAGQSVSSIPSVNTDNTLVLLILDNKIIWL